MAAFSTVLRCRSVLLLCPRLFFNDNDGFRLDVLRLHTVSLLSSHRRRRSLEDQARFRENVSIFMAQATFAQAVNIVVYDIFYLVNIVVYEILPSEYRCM